MLIPQIFPLSLRASVQYLTELQLLLDEGLLSFCFDS